MSWWGKLIGGSVGFAMGGPLGAVLGAALGHNFDNRGKISESMQDGLKDARERTQTAFFTSVFSVMGHLAKADGHVSETEIRMAEQVMDQLELPTEQRRLAIDLFNQGKQDGFPLDDVVRQFRRECRRQQTLMRIFLEVQISAAYADGHMHASERTILERICEILGFSQSEFEHLESMARGETTRSHRSHRDEVANAYKILGVPAKATDSDVKKAYRRLMSQHHPDKLVAKGLPEEMMAVATEKTQEIKSAYELIRSSRK